MSEVQTPISGGIAKFSKSAGILSSGLSLVKGIFFLFIITIILVAALIAGVPWYIVIPFWLFVFGLIILDLIRLKKISEVSLDG